MPAQCPECGRFLKRDLVASLATSAATCPMCETTLTAAMFASDSVRRPDLPEDDVRDNAADVLQGWDVPSDGQGADTAEVVELAGWRRDHQDFPVDAAILAGGGVAGAVVGALVSRDRRGLGATLGAVAGLGAAAASRQIWRLPE